MTAPLRVVSLFSGVGGFDLGLERAGMVTVAQVEWDKKASAVLRHHWPDVPKWADVCDVRGADLPECDVVAFGSPCQDLSVAGKRAGMVEGETRSGLFYEAVRIIKEIQEHGRSAARTPVRWVIWENVVGALSSNGGADFGAVLDAMARLGAVDVQWRILDAQHFGVPQRRRRVFVVARLDPRAVGREQVLPLGASVRRDPTAGGETGEVAAAGFAGGALGGGLPDVAGTLGGGSGERGWPQDVERMTFIPESLRETTSCLRASSMNVDDNTDQDGHLVAEVVTDGATEREREMTLNLPTTVATLSPGAHLGGVNGQDAYTGLIFPTRRLTTSKTYAVARAAEEGGSLAVRRLTPTECERLMGFPDGWTAVGVDGDGAEVVMADSSRYRQCGNGVASPVAEWVGRCIVAAEQELNG